MITDDWQYFLALAGIVLGIGDLVLDALIHIVAALLVHIVVDGVREIAEDWYHCVAVDYSPNLTILFVFRRCLFVHVRIPYLHWRHSLV